MTARHLTIRVIGDGYDGPTVLMLDGAEIVCRFEPTKDTTRYRCTSCGNGAEPCAHLRIALTARHLLLTGVA